LQRLHCLTSTSGGRYFGVFITYSGKALN